MKVDRLDEILRGARLTEGERVARVREAGGFPEGCGPAPSVAPARGALRVSEMKAVYPKGEDQFEVKSSGFAGRRTAQVADVFDLMAARGSRSLSVSQVAVARFYRDLKERHAAGGMRCVSLEAMPSGSGGGSGEFIDAFVAEGRQIAAMERRIGDGVALAAVRGSGGSITDADLVAMVCLRQMTFGACLRARGWSSFGGHRAALAEALGASLDRMGCTVGVVRSAVFRDGDVEAAAKKVFEGG